MPDFYRKQMSKTLEQYVDEVLETDVSGQLSVFEELALMRASARDAVQLYNEAQESPQATLQQRALAGQIMRDVLKEVVDAVTRGANIEASMKDRLTVHHLRQVVMQIVRIAHDTLKTQDAKAFERAVREQIRITADEREGTTVTPDQIVQSMDMLTAPVPPTLEAEAEFNDSEEE